MTFTLLHGRCGIRPTGGVLNEDNVGSLTLCFEPAAKYHSFFFNI